LCPFFWKNSKYNFFSLTAVITQITLFEIEYRSK